MTGNRKTGEPRLGSFASWLVLTASFGLSASTWIAIAVLAGFTSSLTVADVTVRLSWLMPIVVDGYVVVALVLWMAPVPAKVAAFAKKNTYGAAGIGIAAQSAYHLLTVWSETGVVWRMIFAAVVGALPPAVAGLAVHMRALIRRESNTPPGTVTATAATTTTEPARPAQAVQPVLPTNAVPVAVPRTTHDRPTPMDSSPEDRSREAPTAGSRPATVVETAVPPTPADLAQRITRPTHPAAPTGSVAASGPAAPVHPHRSNSPTTPASQLAPSATDSVTAPDAAQLLHLPLLDPALLERGRLIAEQYGTEHGTPITVGQLAVRLQVPSDTASQVLAVITGTNPKPTTVNGRRPAKATR